MLVGDSDPFGFLDKFGKYLAIEMQAHELLSNINLEQVIVLLLVGKKLLFEIASKIVNLLLNTTDFRAID